MDNNMDRKSAIQARLKNFFLNKTVKNKKKKGESTPEINP